MRNTVSEIKDIMFQNNLFEKYNLNIYLKKPSTIDTLVNDLLGFRKSLCRWL